MTGHTAWDDESALVISFLNSGLSFLNILPRYFKIKVVNLIFYHTKLKDDYLKIIKDTGFKVKILSEDKDISKRQYQGIPLESLKIEAIK